MSDIDSDIFGSKPQTQTASPVTQITTNQVPHHILNDAMPQATDLFSLLYSKMSTLNTSGVLVPKKVITVQRNEINVKDLFLDVACNYPIDYAAYQKVDSLFNRIMKSDKFQYVMPSDVCKYIGSIVNFKKEVGDMGVINLQGLNDYALKFDDRSYFSPYIRRNLSPELQTSLIHLDMHNYFTCKRISSTIDLFIRRLMYKLNCNFTDASKLMMNALQLLHIIHAHFGITVDVLDMSFVMHLNWSHLQYKTSDYINQFRFVIFKDYASIDEEWLPLIFDKYLHIHNGVVYTLCTRNRELTYQGYPTYMQHDSKPVIIAWGKPEIPDGVIVDHGFGGSISGTSTVYRKDVLVAIKIKNTVVDVPIYIIDLFTDIVNSIIYCLSSGEFNIYECVALYTSAHSYISHCSNDIILVYIKLMHALSHPQLVKAILADIASTNTELSDAMSKVNKQGLYQDKKTVSKYIFNSIDQINVSNYQSRLFLNGIAVCGCTIKEFMNYPELKSYKC